MKKYQLRGRVVVITGATGGLGQAAAKALLEKGAKLALLDINEGAVRKMAAELGSTKVVAGWPVDVCSMSSIETAMEKISKHFGELDVVVAGAGVSSVVALEHIDLDNFARVIDINLNGVARTFQAALPYVRERQGYLLAISSMAAFIHSPLNTAYTASKAGVWAMCNSLRLELKQYGVGVGTLHPTFFQTPMMEAVVDGPSSTLVWNNHKGLWKFVSLEDVVAALVSSIEKRAEINTVPSRNSLVAKAPGLFRKLVERFGFDDKRVEEAVRKSKHS